MAETLQSDPDYDLLRQEERRGHTLAFVGRVVAIGLMSILIYVNFPGPGKYHFYIFMVLGLITGGVALIVDKAPWGKPWHLYSIIAVELAGLAFLLLSPNLFYDWPYPPQAQLHRDGHNLSLFFLITILAFLYRPLLILWGGACLAVFWSIGSLKIRWLPDSVAGWPDWLSGPWQYWHFDGLPTRVNVNQLNAEVAVLLTIAILLALTTWRSRSLVRRQAKLQRERTNLARYFPPKTAEMLASKSEPLSEVREHNAAVLFADIVGFSTWSEERQPREVIEMLRELHGLMTECVFANNGTVDKFVGDGMMATFGTPDPTPEDAANAVQCVRDILNRVDDWNNSREELGKSKIAVSLGVHFGPVVVGDIGSEDRLELAVLGDTVNVASRLEGLTRSLKCAAVVSGDLVEAAQTKSDAAIDELLSSFSKGKAMHVKGRDKPVAAWTL